MQLRTLYYPKELPEDLGNPFIQLRTLNYPELPEELGNLFMQLRTLNYPEELPEEPWNLFLKLRTFYYPEELPEEPGYLFIQLRTLNYHEEPGKDSFYSSTVNKKRFFMGFLDGSSFQEAFNHPSRIFFHSAWNIYP